MADDKTWALDEDLPEGFDPDGIDLEIAVDRDIHAELGGGAK